MRLNSDLVKGAPDRLECIYLQGWHAWCFSFGVECATSSDLSNFGHEHLSSTLHSYQGLYSMRLAVREEIITC